MQADFRESTLEPTDVPNELATSFAPIPNDNINATTKLIKTNQYKSGERASIIKFIIIIFFDEKEVDK